MTETLFVVAVSGTVAWIVDSSGSTVTVVATTVPNLTVSGVVKVAPVMSITSPRGAEPGLKPVILGRTLKVPALVPVETTFVTAIVPLCAPAGTVSLTCVAETGVIVVTGVPPIVAELIPEKFVPETVTTVPTAAAVGLKPLIAGPRMTVKLAALVAVPAAVVTETLFVVAVSGTVAWIVDSSGSTVTVVATTVPNLTVSGVVKVAPVMSITSPRGAEPGLKPVILGRTLKVPALVPVETTFVTAIVPLCAPAGTVSLTCVAETGVIVVTGVPPIVAELIPEKFVPETVTTVPTAAAVGLKPLIAGPRMTVKLAALVAVPAAVVTETLFVVAVSGTVAWIVDSSGSTVTVVATTVPNLTVSGVVKVAPVMSITSPRGAEPGLKPVILDRTLKVPALVPVETTFVTAIVPLCAPAGTVSLTCVAETGVIVVTGVPPIVAELIPEKFVPETVTTVPTAAAVGLKPLIAGPRMTVKLAALVAVPAAVVTETLFVVAVSGPWRGSSTRPGRP